MSVIVVGFKDGNMVIKVKLLCITFQISW